MAVVVVVVELDSSSYVSPSSEYRRYKHTLDRSAASIFCLSEFAELSWLFELALRARSTSRFPYIHLERAPLEANRAHGRLQRLDAHCEEARIAYSRGSICLFAEQT